MNSGTAAVLGAGPAGLMAAETLATAGVAVTVFDRMPTAGRKFLMAGRGGLNLTHGEPQPVLQSRYRPSAPALAAAVDAFPPARLRAWCEALGQPTFVGSSGRVFPRSMKASPLLRAWLRRLAGQGVRFALRHRWEGWTEAGMLAFDSPAGRLDHRPDVALLALGGGSWPGLGSDGRWVDTVAAAGVAVAGLQPSNCGFRVVWSAHVRDRFEGTPLHNVALRFGASVARGEALITREGLEGGAVYALSGPLRDAIARDGAATILIDLRPDLETGALRGRLETRGAGQSLSTALRKALRLAPAAIGLLNEAALAAGTRLAALDPGQIAERVKAVPVRLTGTTGLARAISSAGGVRFDGITDDFMLRARPGTFVAGEMLDWEAPTGGYLLQACFATGYAAGQGALAWLRTPNRRTVPRVQDAEEQAMRDYTLAIGRGEPYGFSASDDRAAALHVVDYLGAQASARSSEAVPVLLMGPDGLLSGPDEDAAAFCRRIQSTHLVENTDDVRVADPTPPDCNTM